MDELEVRVHDEITGYKERFFGLTMRQWVAIAIVFIINVPTYLLGLYFGVNDQLLKLLVVVFAILPSLWGFVRIQNMNAEVYIRYIFRHYGLFGKQLSYQSDADYEAENSKTRKQVRKERKASKKQETQTVIKKSRAEKRAERKLKKQEQKALRSKKKKIKEERKQARLLAKAYAKYGLSEEEEITVKKESSQASEIEITEEDLELIKKFKMLEELQKTKANEKEG